ncbi:hypothetical protein BIZ95_gp15 [Pseudomonas phage vB_PaeP_MAG4]|uniref:Uncharacterized protein n=1 Tax=Pseudomonas phage vB_PaeP_MAG4 TaxID=1639814 RepID=A0A172B615_9CAUD|nr:hypothetical protein BIZ95_gp15 [Pseudomonas phage vB_PaeP_MAG4]AKH49458.1 hypothetical protein vB_PaeP_fi6_015 [Pseudomonas phage vB_PaeP_MAG4]
MDTNQMIFVFGSNTAGIHGAGAAKYARFNKGAELGVGEGPTGMAYALPTKHRGQKGLLVTCPISDVAQAVQRFMDYAREHFYMRFQVTRIGCGLAGFRDSEIAPLFRDAPDNCYFDTAWTSWLKPTAKYWGTM